ncbi:MAG: TIGR03936 family radical SAM-associated protein [Acutalibacteraceae bacterium]|nr:TIGR03936 family radical SAM-associated protein [Acutalibacteraceae bacterium]
MRSVRLNFSKIGRAIYISHLDVNRMMTRAVRRAQLPMWYTEGFNPHPYIAFALPLSLGQSSDCEYMDIRIEGDMTDEEVMTRLNDTLPEGLKILSVGAPVFDAKEIEKAQYFVKIVFETNEEASLFAEKADELLKGEELMAEKPGKKGHRKIMKQVNLIDMIFDAKITSADNIVNLQCVLAAGNTHNLNPTLLVETIENCVALRHTQLHIVRKRLITKNNKNFR